MARATRARDAGHLTAIRRFRAECAERDAPCWLCGQSIDYTAPPQDYSNPGRFQADHYYPVSTHPELQRDPAGWRPSHAGCNNARGNTPARGTLTGTTSRDWT